MGLLKGWAKVTPVEATDKPKVLIGVAGFHGVVPEGQESFFELAYDLGRRHPEYDFLLKIIIKREQFRARNSLVDLAIVNGCDYLWMLDDDMVIPPGAFTKLMSHQKDVIGALYFQRGGAYHPVLMKRYAKKDGLVGVDFLHHFDKMLVDRGLYEIDGVIGGGCMLFKVDVFRKIPQPYFWIDGIVGTDVHVCQQLRDAGVKLWVDTSVELGHIGEGKIVGTHSIPQYSRRLGQLNEELWEDLRDYLSLDNLQLESELYQSSESASRMERWNEIPRTTWEGVRSFYQSYGNWQVLNLAKFNLQFDTARDWAVNQIATRAKPGEHIADIGCGLGYCTIPTLRAGYRVTAIDLAETPTLKFLRWRVKKHLGPDTDATLSIVECQDPVPPELPAPVDGVLMISVFDHLWDPIGMLDWLGRNVRRGGWLLCDTIYNMKSDTEPQHLIKYNPHTIQHEIRKRGWRDVPDNPFLFLKET